MKVAIIGAGINGLYLAKELAQKGHDITVFERRLKIGKEACSGLFSERILSFIPESRSLIQNEISSVLIHFPRKTVKVRFSKKFFVMSHYDLDNLAADMARESGVKIILNSNLTRKGLVELEGEYERIIGCDGPLSETRKYLKLKDPQFRLGIQGVVQEKDSSDSVETWATKNGFIWRIPRGKEVEYGVFEKADKAKIVFDEFLREKNLKLGKIESALIPQGLLIPNNPCVTLCGDAAGLTKPWSGGGVVWGLVAADMLLKSFPDFVYYHKAVRRFFSPRIALSKAVRDLAYFFGFNFPWAIPSEIGIESDFLA